MNEPVLVLGKDGILGRALCAQLGARAIGLSHAECDFVNVAFIEAVDAAYHARPFAAILNAAAYTAVDAAEEEDSGTLLRVNAVAPGELAAWCAKHDVALVHFSTDYVFNGQGTKPWAEHDTPAPLNAYGMSKQVGERAVEAVGGKYLIFRTSWVYGPQGKNFFTRMRTLMREREVLTVVDDQVGAPTYAAELAMAVVTALSVAAAKDVFPRGIYHLTHSGEVSWCGFARAMLAHEQAQGVMCKEVQAISTEAYGAAASRPMNSRLDCTKARMVFAVTLPSWEEGLAACFLAAPLP